MMKKCPKCDVDLTTKSIGPVEVDECPTCRGTWFDKDELRQAEDVTDSDLDWMDFEIWKHEKEFRSKASTLQCPTCHKPMASLHYGDTAVTIDYCQSCLGTWLDKGEFKKIIHAMEKEILSKPSSEYMKETLREGAEIVAHPQRFLSEWKDFVTVLRLMQYRFFAEHPTLRNTMTSMQKTVQ
jgi:Zn-finger nucleic acid-binding protein